MKNCSEKQIGNLSSTNDCPMEVNDINYIYNKVGYNTQCRTTATYKH